MLIYSAHGQHDVGMRIAVTFIMQRPVCYHPFAHKILLNVTTHTHNLRFPVKLFRKGHFDFSCKLRVRSLFNLLDFIPQYLTIFESFGRMRGQEDLAHNDPAFFGEIMREACLFIS